MLSVMATTKERSITVRFPIEMADRLTTMAKSRYRSINGEILAAVEKELKAWEAEQGTQ